MITFVKKDDDREEKMNICVLTLYGKVANVDGALIIVLLLTNYKVRQKW